MAYTYRDHMTETRESLTWCQALSNESGTIQCVSLEGRLESFQVDGKYMPTTKDLINQIARRLTGSNYEMFQGWTDEELIRQELQERPCCECPWFNECEAMDQEDWQE